MTGAGVWQPTGFAEAECEGKNCIAMEDWMHDVGLMAREFAMEPCPPIPNAPSEGETQFVHHNKKINMMGGIMQMTHTNQYHILPCRDGECKVVEKSVTVDKPLPPKPAME